MTEAVRTRLVAFGGTTRSGSSTERALRVAANAAEQMGAEVTVFDGPFLARLPMYAPENRSRTGEEIEFVAAVRNANALMIASPGYHGGISGLVKNAIDLLEDTSKDDRVYIDSIPVGLIVTAHGWQATASTLASLRAVIHALRGWPTPLGVAINSVGGIFDENGLCKDEAVSSQLKLVAAQICNFAFGSQSQRIEADG